MRAHSNREEQVVPNETQSLLSTSVVFPKGISPLAAQYTSNRAIYDGRVTLSHFLVNARSIWGLTFTSKERSPPQSRKTLIS